MEDTIEICAGCGKMPRPVDRTEGFFICSRCGNRSTVMVTAEDYERVAMDLDQKFHEKIMKYKADEAKKEPAMEFGGNPGPGRKKPTKSKKAKKPSKKKAPAKKTAKKKAKKKPAKKKASKKKKKRR